MEDDNIEIIVTGLVSDFSCSSAELLSDNNNYLPFTFCFLIDVNRFSLYGILASLRTHRTWWGRWTDSRVGDRLLILELNLPKIGMSARRHDFYVNEVYIYINECTNFNYFE